MPALHRRAKEIARQSLHALFIGGQHFGIDILPRHFYSEIPDFRELRKDDAWKHPRSMYGVNGADVDQQLAFVRDCVNDSARTLMREENIYESACRDNGEAATGRRGSFRSVLEFQRRCSCMHPESATTIPLSHASIRCRANT